MLFSCVYVYALTNFSSGILTSGSIDNSDPLWNYQVSNPSHVFNHCFLKSVTLKNTIQPEYGNNWFWNGKAIMGPGTILSDNYIWGHSHDTALLADNQEAINLLNNQPRNVAQVKFWEMRTKYWNYYGREIDQWYKPKWTVDGGIFFPDSQRYKADFDGNITYALSSFPFSRILNKEVFALFDHPGIQEAALRLIPPNYDGADSAEVVVMYANFIVQFLRDNPQEVLANELHYHIKLLLRVDTLGTTPSGYFGNAEFGSGHITIPDWQSAPSGINFPS